MERSTRPAAFCGSTSPPRAHSNADYRSKVARSRTCPLWASSSEASNFTELATPEEFETILKKSNADGKPVVCAYHASWCSKCKQMYPRFKTLVPDFPDAHFCGVNIQVVAGLPRRNNVTRIPHFQIFTGGELTYDVNGSGDKDQVIARLRKLLGDEQQGN